MADEPVKPDDEPRPPHGVYSLNYAPPESAPVRRKVGALIGGGFIAVMILLVVGALAYPYPLGRPSGPTLWRAVAAWALLAIGAWAGVAFLARRRPLAPSRWFIMGLLIGTGIVALLEGACYAKP